MAGRLNCGFNLVIRCFCWISRQKHASQGQSHGSESPARICHGWKPNSTKNSGSGFWTFRRMKCPQFMNSSIDTGRKKACLFSVQERISRTTWKKHSADGSPPQANGGEPFPRKLHAAPREKLSAGSYALRAQIRARISAPISLQPRSLPPSPMISPQRKPAFSVWSTAASTAPASSAMSKL